MLYPRPEQPITKPKIRLTRYNKRVNVVTIKKKLTVTVLKGNLIHYVRHPLVKCKSLEKSNLHRVVISADSILDRTTNIVYQITSKEDYMIVMNKLYKLTKRTHDKIFDVNMPTTLHLGARSEGSITNDIAWLQYVDEVVYDENNALTVLLCYINNPHLNYVMKQN